MTKYAIEGTEEYRQADEKRKMPMWLFRVPLWLTESKEGKRIAQALRSLIEKHGGGDG